MNRSEIRSQQVPRQRFDEIPTQICPILDNRSREPSEGKSVLQVTDSKILGVRYPRPDIALLAVNRRGRTLRSPARQHTDSSFQRRIGKPFLEMPPAFLSCCQYLLRVSGNCQRKTNRVVNGAQRHFKRVEKGVEALRLGLHLGNGPLVYLPDLLSQFGSRNPKRMGSSFPLKTEFE